MLNYNAKLLYTKILISLYVIFTLVLAYSQLLKNIYPCIPIMFHLRNPSSNKIDKKNTIKN